MRPPIAFQEDFHVTQQSRLAAMVAAGAISLGAAAPAVAAPVQVNQGNLISALNNVALEIDRLEALNNLTVQDVRVVNVEDVLNNANVLNNSLNRNDVRILQNFLNNNDIDVSVVIQDVLNDNNVNVNDVVAVDVLSNGDVIVFTR